MATTTGAPASDDAAPDPAPAASPRAERPAGGPRRPDPTGPPPAASRLVGRGAAGARRLPVAADGRPGGPAAGAALRRLLRRPGPLDPRRPPRRAVRGRAVRGLPGRREIGRASCRERV